MIKSLVCQHLFVEEYMWTVLSQESILCSLKVEHPLRSALMSIYGSAFNVNLWLNLWNWSCNLSASLCMSLRKTFASHHFWCFPVSRIYKLLSLSNTNSAILIGSERKISTYITLLFPYFSGNKEIKLVKLGFKMNLIESSKSEAGQYKNLSSCNKA